MIDADREFALEMIEEVDEERLLHDEEELD
jgi:hypothetical protein